MDVAAIAGKLIIAIDDMLDRTVVPHQDITDLPFVMILELRFHDMFRQALNKRQCFVVGHAFDAGAFV